MRAQTALHTLMLLPVHNALTKLHRFEKEKEFD